MKDERILFIGGPKDGKREAIHAPLHHVQCATFEPLSRNLPDALSPLSLGAQTHHFTIKQFVAEDGSVLKVAVHSDVKDVMKQLVKGYRYHRRSRSKYR